MKKNLLTVVCLGTLIIGSSVQAIDLKSTSMSTLKKATTTTSKTTTTAKKADTAAQDAAFQKQFQTTINSSEKKLITAKNLAQTAHWDLASVLLDKDTLADFNKKKNDINSNKELTDKDKNKQLNALEDELIKAMNTVLSAKTFDYEANIKQVNEAKYINAVKNIQIANNRYDNITNTMSPCFNKLVQGTVSIFAVKTELKESGVLTVDVQNAKIDDMGLLRNLNKINERNSVYIEIPESEKVVFSKDGIIGGINYQINDVNQSVESSYGDLIKAFNLTNDIKKIETEINNNPDLTKMEKNIQKKKARTDALADKLQEVAVAQKTGEKVELTAAQKTAIANATSKLISASINYTTIAGTCALLGFKIYKNPLLAVPLAPEVTQLKFTATVLKEAASAIKKVSTQTIKLCKINGIKYEDPTSKAKSSKKVNLNLTNTKKSK